MRASMSALAVLAMVPMAAATLSVVPAAAAASQSAGTPAATQTDPPVSTPTIEVVEAPNPLVRAATPSEADEVSEEIAELGAGRLDGPRTQVITAERAAGFSLVGVTWTSTEQPGTAVSVRTRTGAGAWGEDIHAHVAHQQNPDSPLRGTEAAWTNQATSAEITITSPDGSVPSGVAVNLIDPLTESKQIPAGATAQAPNDAASPDGTASPDDATAQGALRATSVPRPGINSRASWGANESLRRGSPRYQSSVDALAVHHTAGSNNYSCSQVPAQMRGLYAYATQTLGWSDIAYNMLIDKCGGIWEGTAGGVASSVASIHTGGFNSRTQGYAMIGNFETAAAPPAMINSLVRLLAWKASSFGINPRGTVALTQQGGNGTTAKFRDGQRVTVPTIFPHRAVGNTSCPGQNVVNQLGSIISRVAQAASSPGSGPKPPEVRAYLANGYPGGRAAETSFGRRGDRPVMCDWNGDGRDTLGVFRSGRWYLRNSNTDGPGEISASFGRGGDQPVCGDWNGDGRDTLGVFRGGIFYLTNSVRGGRVSQTVAYGRPGDVAVVGDWDGDKIDTPGVARNSAGKQVYLTNSFAGGRTFTSFAYGRSGDAIVAGDWDGDRRDSIGVYRSGDVFLTDSNGSRPRTVKSYRLGRAGDRPLAANLDARTQDSVSVARGY